MGNWFSRLFGAEDSPTPQGFRRISELNISVPEKDHSYLILDWRLAPSPPHDYGSILLWLEVDGQRGQFFLSKREALYYDTVLTSNATHIRVVKNRGCWYVLPVNPRKEEPLRKLPPPPKSFPPAPTSVPPPPP